MNAKPSQENIFLEKKHLHTFFKLLQSFKKMLEASQDSEGRQNEKRRFILNRTISRLNYLCSWLMAYYSYVCGALEEKKELIMELEKFRKNLSPEEIQSGHAFPFLLKRKEYVEKKVKELNEASFSKTEKERIETLQARILLSHLNNHIKLQNIKNYAEKIKKKGNITLCLPGETKLSSLFPYKELRKNDFEKRVKDVFQISSNSLSLGYPFFSFGFEEFLSLLEKGEKSLLVSGFCPLSFVSDTITFAFSDREFEINLSHGQLTSAWTKHLKKIKGKEALSFRTPPTPYLSDAVNISLSFQFAEYLKKRFDYALEVWFWFPIENYVSEFCSLARPLLTEGLIQEKNIRDAFSLTRKRYSSLLSFINKLYPQISAEIVDDSLLWKERERIKEKRKSLEFVQYYYGRYRFTTDEKKRLYQNVVLMHVFFAEMGFNTLHIEDSYEIWPNLDASLYLCLEKNKCLGNYGWLCYPSLPSMSLKNLREFNASPQDKIYLFENRESLKEKIEKSSFEFLFLTYSSLLRDKHTTILEEKSVSRKKKISFLKREILKFFEEFLN